MPKKSGVGLLLAAAMWLVILALAAIGYKLLLHPTIEKQSPS